jgi:lysophospholipase L1-like esterase
MPTPGILIVAPPAIQDPSGPLAPKFIGGDAKCAGLSEAYQEVAKSLKCAFFDAARVTSSSRVDGIHLDEDQHSALGKALAPVVRELL